MRCPWSQFAQPRAPPPQHAKTGCRGPRAVPHEYRENSLSRHGGGNILGIPRLPLSPTPASQNRACRGPRVALPFASSGSGSRAVARNDRIKRRPYAALKGRSSTLRCALGCPPTCQNPGSLGSRSCGLPVNDCAQARVPVPQKPRASCTRKIRSIFSRCLRFLAIIFDERQPQVYLLHNNGGAAIASVLNQPYFHDEKQPLKERRGDERARTNGPRRKVGIYRSSQLEAVTYRHNFKNHKPYRHGLFPRSSER